MDDVSRISVCFVSIDIYPLFNTRAAGVQGGSEVDFYMLATELAKDPRFNVSIVTGDFGQSDVEIFGNITVYKAADIQKSFFSGVAALWKAMRRANADIYFKKGAALTTDFVALFCRFNNKKFFLRTGTDYECNGDYFREHPVKARTYLWSVRHASCVFVQKLFDVERFQHITGVTPVAIPNGHRMNQIQQQLPSDFILWVGRTDDLKQPRLFVELARQVPSEQFVMICQKAKGDKRYDELIQHAVSVSNLKFIESVPFNEVDRYFQQAKILVNTSRAEGFPNTFIQAGKCTVPILTLAVNPDGFLDNYKCGICCNGDMSKMAPSLKYLLEQNRYIEAGKNSKIYVEQNHDVTRIIELYKQHFKDALKSAG
jgi:glycosyltransferase involved in cell wall biosynthesis